jgi:gliding motility-associated-like protein
MTVTSIYGCVVTETFTNIIQVDPVPDASFLLTKNPVSWFEPITIANDNSTGDISSWQWFSQDAVNYDPTGTSSTFTFPEGQTGIYPIRLIVSSPQGCRDTAIVDLIVASEVLLYVPNTFTPDNDEHNQTWKFHIEGIDIMNFRVEIFNRWGEKIWESNDPFVEWDGTYGGYKVQKGTYTWKMTYKEKNSDGRTTKMGTLNVLK